MADKSKKHITTTLATASLSPKANHGIPNPPIYRASTIISDRLAQYRGEEPQDYDYGRVGTPTSEAFERAVAAIYGADDVVSTPSGLSAISLALLAFAKSGDHLLFPDSLYGSSRRFVTKMLVNYGIDVSFYPARVNSDIESYIKPNTTILYLESPGSLTFELQDIPAMVEIAKQNHLLTMIDNTWGTALHHNAFDKGVDIIIEAATKYITGHSDVNLGVVCAKGNLAKKLRFAATAFGICAGPEDLYLGVRGLRTMSVRLKQSEAAGLALAQFVEAQPDVLAVLHPALPSSPDHALFQRDFSGSCGLFGFVLSPDIPQTTIDKAANSREIFHIGASWGGFESLLTQAILTPNMRVHPTNLPEGYLMRIYAGLEDIDDLKSDLAGFFAMLR
ncbi:MAG: cystathionine beta-lyase [Candidatus Puniceispirillaceae bacterium]